MASKVLVLSNNITQQFLKWFPKSPIKKVVKLFKLLFLKIDTILTKYHLTPTSGFTAQSNLNDFTLQIKPSYFAIKTPCYLQSIKIIPPQYIQTGIQGVGMSLH